MDQNRELAGSVRTTFSRLCARLENLVCHSANTRATFATITHAAGISSTGDEDLDRLLPFDRPYRIPAATAKAVADAHEAGVSLQSERRSCARLKMLQLKMVNCESVRDSPVVALVQPRICACCRCNSQGLTNAGQATTNSFAHLSMMQSWNARLKCWTDVDTRHTNSGIRFLSLQD